MIISSILLQTLYTVQYEVQAALGEAMSDGLAAFISEYLDETDAILSKKLSVRSFLTTMRKMMAEAQQCVDTEDEDNESDSANKWKSINRQTKLRLQQCHDSFVVMPNFIDVITGEYVIKPAISPYGHVLSYETWTKLLRASKKNVCPFTLQKLTRRDLVKLTLDNIHDFKHQIKDISEAKEDNGINH